MDHETVEAVVFLMQQAVHENIVSWKKEKIQSPLCIWKKKGGD